MSGGGRYRGESVQGDLSPAEKFKYYSNRALSVVNNTLAYLGSQYHRLRSRRTVDDGRPDKPQGGARHDQEGSQAPRKLHGQSSSGKRY